jgi:hypothetical protein
MPQRLTGNHCWDFHSHDLPELLKMCHWQSTDVVHATWRCHISAVPCEMLSWPMDRMRRTHCMTSTIRASSESPEFLPVKTPETSCSSCWQRTGSSQLHCGCLSDYPQLHRHLWADAAVHDEMYWAVSAMTQITCFQTHVDIDILYCFGMRNSCPKSVPRLSIISYIQRNTCRQQSESNASPQRISLTLARTAGPITALSMSLTLRCEQALLPARGLRGIVDTYSAIARIPFM